MGRWAEPASYSINDVNSVVAYAEARGIRVVPEVDVPGHTYSWGLAYPGINADCPAHIDSDIGRINDTPLDPTNPLALDVVGTIIGEMAQRFPDTFLHIGGDEFDANCWTSTPRIAKYMHQHNKSTRDLQVDFERQVTGLLAARQRTAIVWEEAFLAIPEVFANETLVEVWSNMSTVNVALRSGMDVIVAGEFYLDRQVRTPKVVVVVVVVF